MKISDKDLIENLQNLARALGRAPKKKDLQLAKGSKYGAPAYQRAFGGVSNALLKAGLKPHQIRGASKEQVIQDIIYSYNVLGYTPKHKEYQQVGIIAYSFPIIKKLFGSWTKALIEAKIPITNAGKVNKKFIIEELNKWYLLNNDLGDLSYWSIRNAKKNGRFPFSCTTIRNHFKGMSWQDIMQQIDPRYETKDPFIRKYKHKGVDGNIYKSLLELQVGNHLFFLKSSNKIKDYKYEVPICKEKTWTCDFLIIKYNKEIWLEVDGMRGNRKIPYKEGNSKIRYYKEHNMNYKIVSYGWNLEI